MFSVKIPRSELESKPGVDEIVQRMWKKGTDRQSVKGNKGEEKIRERGK